MRKSREEGPQAKARCAGKPNKPQACASKIRVAFQAAMMDFRGFNQPKGDNPTSDDFLMQYSDLKSERNKQAALNGLKGFISGNNFSFVVDLLHNLSKPKRRAVIKELLLRFASDSIAVLGESEVEKELGIKCMKMSMEDAVVLFYSGNYSHVQWDTMAAAVNRMMDANLRKMFGRAVPTVRAMLKHLKSDGALLEGDGIAVVELHGEEGDIVDLTLDDKEEVVEEGTAVSESPQTVLRGVFVKNVMGKLIQPELRTIRKLLPRSWRLMLNANCINIVIAIDNTSRQTFSGQTVKLEQAVLKIIIPGVKSAQQSPCLAIPIFFMEGDETYSALHKILNQMVDSGSLTNTVQIPADDGEGEGVLDVRWHLCSDHKLVAMFGGFGGSGCNKPCFLCNWDRTNPYSPTAARTEADILKKSAWAVQYMKPIQDASLKVKLAQGKLTEARKPGAKTKPDIMAKLQTDLHAAKSERRTAFQKVGGMLQNEPEHELAQLLNSAPFLQKRAAALKGKHLERASGELADAVHADLQLLQDQIQNAQHSLQLAQDVLHSAEKSLAQCDVDQLGDETHDRLLDMVEQAADHLQDMEDHCSGLAESWTFEVDKVNGLDGLIVKVSGGQVQVMKPALQFANMATDFLHTILSDACEGLYRGCMVKELVPPSRWYLEALHLIINTGNGWIEVARNTFQYLLTAEGVARNRNEPGHSPEEWEQATSSSRQSKTWTAAGFDLEKHIKRVLGSKLAKPLTKFHGAQIEAIFRNQDMIWAAEPLASGLAELEKDDEAAAIVNDLKSTLEALGRVHQQVSIAKPDVAVMEQAVKQFGVSHKRFTSPQCLAPCRYRMKFYDHAILQHLLEQTRELGKFGMSLAMVSSKFLEANNKVVKAVMRRLPGGGRSRAGHAHLPLVQGLKRCIAMATIGRPKLYKHMMEEEDI